eukprot:scaffold26811_cov84-Isochrysis_galbana.AAC.1
MPKTNHPSLSPTPTLNPIFSPPAGAFKPNLPYPHPHPSHINLPPDPIPIPSTSALIIAHLHEREPRQEDGRPRREFVQPPGALRPSRISRHHTANPAVNPAAHAHAHAHAHAAADAPGRTSGCGCGGAAVARVLSQ